MTGLIDAAHALAGKVIAVPEMRQLDVFSGLLERRGATVLRCPLIAIKDAPNPQPVLAWLRDFMDGSCDDLILLTGEGLRRLLACLDQHQPDWRGAFIERLAQVRIGVRGPKPAKALREIGLQPTWSAVEPTTAGVIASLPTMHWQARRVGVQLYGGIANPALIDALHHAGATTSIVAPYVYADAIDDAAVVAMAQRMAAGEVHIIAFTSMAQVKRLCAVCSHELLQAAFARVQVAAVGPVVRDALEAQGISVQCMPEDSFFMKPLVTEMSRMSDSAVES